MMDVWPILAISILELAQNYQESHNSRFKGGVNRKIS